MNVYVNQSYYLFVQLSPVFPLYRLSFHGFHVKVFNPPLPFGYNTGTGAFREKRNESTRQGDLDYFLLRL